MPASSKARPPEIATTADGAGRQPFGANTETAAGPAFPLHDEPLRIVYADDALIAIDKPPGMLSVPGRGADKQDCAAHRVQAQFTDARVVHRLDMATSGLLLFARGEAMQRALGSAFAGRELTKRYLAIVDGLLQPAHGEIELPLGADWPNRPRQQVDLLHGRPSLTRYRVLNHDTTLQRSRLELAPVTGRTHQLRVHLLALGHPIVGDALYAPPQVATASPRLLLHAEHLCLRHPANGRTLDLHSPAPF